MDRHKRAVIAAFAIVLLAACGGGSSGGQGGGGGGPSAPVATMLAKVVVDQTASPTATYQMEGGQYKISWTSTGCTNLDVQVKQTDGSFSYDKPTTRTSFLAIISQLPQGLYTITQADPSCTTWSVTLESTAG